jgi:hypothetical protein
MVINKLNKIQIYPENNYCGKSKCTFTIASELLTNLAAKMPNLLAILHVNQWHFLTLLRFVRLRSFTKPVLLALGSPSVNFHFLMVLNQTCWSKKQK